MKQIAVQVRPFLSLLRVTYWNAARKHLSILCNTVSFKTQKSTHLKRKCFFYKKNCLTFLLHFCCWFYYINIHLAFCLPFIWTELSACKLEVLPRTFFPRRFCRVSRLYSWSPETTFVILQVASISELTLYGLTTLAVLLGLLQMRGWVNITVKLNLYLLDLFQTCQSIKILAAYISLIFSNSLWSVSCDLVLNLTLAPSWV